MERERVGWGSVNRIYKAFTLGRGAGAPKTGSRTQLQVTLFYLDAEEEVEE